MELITRKDINDSGNVKFTFSPQTPAGVAITPLSAVWKLTDLYGTVINDRTAEEIDPLSSELVVLLTGDDLAMQDSSNVYEKRLVTMVCTYDAGGGVTADLVNSAMFSVNNEKGVA